VSPLLDRAAIQQILPHRDPFLFVDEVLELVPRQRVVGVVRSPETGSLLKDAASGDLGFPATLLLEAMAQVGAILVLHPEENRGRTIYFRSIDSARFHLPVPAGAVIRVEGVVRRIRGRLGTLEMRAFFDDRLAAEGLMSFAL
jgi:3-hydroxyacyl-[acyl-carrier-protein] dehydratase